MRDKVACNKCGSIYLISSTKIIFRDKDSIECQICDSTIFSWNEAKTYSAELLEKHDNFEKV